MNDLPAWKQRDLEEKAARDEESRRTIRMVNSEYVQKCLAEAIAKTESLAVSVPKSA